MYSTLSSQDFLLVAMLYLHRTQKILRARKNSESISSHFCSWQGWLNYSCLFFFLIYFLIKIILMLESTSLDLLTFCQRILYQLIFFPRTAVSLASAHLLWLLTLPFLKKYCYRIDTPLVLCYFLAVRGFMKYQYKQARDQLNKLY